MMWGLHKAFYLESQKKIAQLHSLAPVSASRRGRGGWRQRLSQAVHFPSRDEVYRFMDSTGALFAHWIAVKALDDNGKQVMAFVRRGRPQGSRRADH